MFRGKATACVAAMKKRYMLLKCGSDGCTEPIDCITASCMDEAKEALEWMRTHHPERPDLRLEAGEFFEILDEEHCSPEEWRAGLAKLERKRIVNPCKATDGKP